jgi:SRSO17 transposase
MVEAVACAFADFVCRYGGFFRTKTRNNAEIARSYLHGLVQSENCNFSSMADVVSDSCPQRFQHFISCSPWDQTPVIAQIGRDADGLLGGKPTSGLIIDETSFAKQGDGSVGVARQWSGRLGKVDNCQVAVFAVLTDGMRHTPVDARLYLPKVWIDDPERCDRAGIPQEARVLTSKTAHALSIVQSARERGMRFGWVGADGGYGKEPAFLRALDAMNEVFVADVHRTQRLWTERPEIIASRPSPGQDGAPVKRQAATSSVTAENLAKTFKKSDWTRHVLRDSTRGKLQVDIAHRRVWLWDGNEETPRCWHLIIRREVGSPKTIKYSLSNAPADTPVSQLAQMQGQRYWVERAFEDAKGQCGLADYQALGWRAWHHHVTMVMVAMLFIAEQRITYQSDFELLTPRDIVEMLGEALPRKPRTTGEIVEQINRRHQHRQSSIESRYRTQIEIQLNQRDR